MCWKYSNESIITKKNYLFWIYRFLLLTQVHGNNQHINTNKNKERHNLKLCFKKKNDTISNQNKKKEGNK